MKKLIPLIFIVLLIIAGGYFYLKSKSLPPSSILTNAGKVARDGNAITSIKDALSKSLSLTCNYKDDKGRITTMYIKNGSLRSRFEGGKDNTQPNNVIFKDGKMYAWSDTTKEGFVYSMKAADNTSPIPSTGAAGTVTENNSGDKSRSFLADVEKFKNDCKSGTVDDSLFISPTDIKFQDMDAVINNMKQIPTGDVNSGNYEQYLQQITQKPGGQ